MKDLAGFARRYWKTGFTSYRYAIPAFAGDYGRAIYNDFDQVYLVDTQVTLVGLVEDHEYLV